MTVATPRARRVAAELGIDVSAVDGTGRDGRVRERDVRTIWISAHRPAHSGPSDDRRPDDRRAAARRPRSP